MIALLCGLALSVGLYEWAYWFTPLGSLRSYYLTGDREVAGTTGWHSIDDPGSGGSLEYRLYLPPGYESGDRRYPVIYHLHGANPLSPGSTLEFIRKDVNWTAHALERAVADGLVPPALIVAPFDGTGLSMWSDSIDGTVLAESRLIDVLIPHVDATYRTLADRNHRAVQGFSMGGFGAAKAALKYPELFSSAIVYDGALHTWETLTTHRFPRRLGIADDVYGNDEAYFARFSPWRIRGDYEKQPIAVLISVGILNRYNDAFPDRLEEIGVEHVYVDVACGHDLRCLIDETGQDAFRLMGRSF